MLPHASTRVTEPAHIARTGRHETDCYRPYGWEGSSQRPTDRTPSLTSLIQMGARPYAPQIGRFLAVDPVEGGATTNPYGYVNDPISTKDLSGRAKCRKNIVTVSSPGYKMKLCTVANQSGKAPAGKRRVQVDLRPVGAVSTAASLATSVTLCVYNIATMTNRCETDRSGIMQRASHTRLYVGPGDVVYVIAGAIFAGPKGPTFRLFTATATGTEILALDPP